MVWVMQMNKKIVGATIGRPNDELAVNKTPHRKKNRLENHDYSSCGGYFLTICALERRNYFWEHAEANGSSEYDAERIINHPRDVKLSEYGRIVEQAIKNIPAVYPAVTIGEYVIMPDHVHLLLVIHTDELGRPMVAPTMSRIVQQLKGYVTKRIGVSIWQKLFFDHVIRNQQDYQEHVKYIYENPMRWCFGKGKKDCDGEVH